MIWTARARPSDKFLKPTIPQHKVDWSRMVSLDLETYWDVDYTLKKMSTSEYVRDPRFKIQMMGIKIGNGKTRIIPPQRVKAELAKINWSTHSLLCHNTQFDGFVLSHHFAIHPAFLYDSLSMARGLHSNDIGAGLDEVSVFYGGAGKVKDTLEETKGVINWSKELYAKAAIYCANDVDEMFRVFNEMLPKMPDDEIHLIDLTCKMFCDPVLKVDIPRVQVELERELAERERKMYDAVNPADYDVGGDKYDPVEYKTILKTKAERALEGVERDMLIIKRVIGSSAKFVRLLEAEGVEVPLKISPAWMKLSKEERESPEGLEKKYAYAFAKDDIAFVELPNMVESWGFDMETPEGVAQAAAKQTRLQSLIDVRLSVKSTTNVTRAERFLEAGKDGMSLPVGYAYYRAHTGRWGGQNKMNMQNLTRGGELRLSILAPRGHQIAVQDSGQIEARVNGWLWGQTDLLDSFRTADAWDKSKGIARGADRDAYCKFGDVVYGREITTEDKLERFVGKVCLGPETRVLTNHGIKPIIEVRLTDFLWDGTSWVNHQGLLDQGIKQTIRYRGLTATPDHEILTGRGWLAWSEVLTDHSHFHSALDLATLLSSGGSITSQKTENLGATGQYADVPVGPNLWSTLAALHLVGPQDVTLAPRSLQAQNAIGHTKKPWQMTDTEHDCSTDSHQPSQDVLTQTIGHMSTTEDEVSSSIRDGRMTVRHFFALCKRSLAGTFPSLSWIGLTQTSDMSRGTYASSPRQEILRTSAESRTLSSESAISKQTTQTYDLANAGPNHRFTVITDDGPVIVHNCVLGLGFQMGAPKFQMTLAKGALGGPPVHFSLEVCKGVVNSYRSINNRIMQGWQICANIIEDMAAGRKGSYGPLNWEANTIWLPNGMSLKYPDLKQAVGDKGWPEWTYQSGDRRKKIYGGMLCENIVQALARIIVGWQMLQISKKYRVVMTTHDEIVTLPKTAQADACIRFMAKWMSTPPSWCSDIPLNCEGGYAANYSK